MYRISTTVKQLLIINVIFFIGTMSLPEIKDYLSLFFPENDSFWFWQVFTHMFMHADISHLFFNMFALWMFGSAVESMLGSRKFLFFYITCGLGACIIQILYQYFTFYPNLDIIINNSQNFDKAYVLEFLNKFNLEIRYIKNEFLLSNSPTSEWINILGKEDGLDFIRSFATPMVGASGAIMGVLVAFGMFFPENKLMLIFLPIPIKAKYFIPGIILMDLFSAITGTAIFSPSNTAFIAHIGGALTGFLLMYYWKKTQFNRNRWY